MASPSFNRLATVTASTKRSTQTGALRGTPMTYLTGIKCLPLDPVTPEIATHLKLDSGFSTKQTFVDAALDIKRGDMLTVNGVDYPIRAVGRWEWLGSEYLAVVIEEITG